MAEKVDIDKLAEYNKLFKEGKIDKEEFNEIQEKYIKQMKQLNEELEKATIETVALAQAEAELAEMFGDTLSAYEANNEALRQAQELLEAAESSTKDLTQAQLDQIEANYGDVEALKESIKAMEAKKKAIDDLGPAYKKALKLSKPFFEDTATKLGLLSKKGNKFVKTLGAMGKMATQKGGLRGLAAGFFEAFNPLNMGVSILTKVVEATMEMMFAVDNAGAALVKTTGFSRKYDAVIADTNVRMRQFGVTADDAQKALVSLKNRLGDFDNLAGPTRDKLMDLVTGLEKIGVSTAESTEMINSLTKSFDISTSQAADMTRSLALQAEVLGKSASGLLKDYNKTLSTLAMYGDRSVKIFKNIAAMAAAAGVEVGDLMGIADKFRDFSSSAKTAAKMNAILGTSFSGMNMMMMDQDKIIENVIMGLQRTGVQFKNLDKFTQQAIATQLGIKDLDKARKILGMNTSEYRRFQKEQAKTAADTEEFNKRIAAGVKVLDQIKLIFADFAVNMKDFIPTIRKAVEGFGSLIRMISPMGLIFTGLGLSALGFAINIAGLVTKIKIVEKVGGSSIKGLSKAISEGLLRVSKAAGQSSPALGSLSISMSGIALTIISTGAAISGIILSFALLFKTMIDGVVALKQSGAGFKEMAMALGFFAAGIVGVTFAIKGLAAASAALTATGTIGLAIGGVIAGVAGIAFGVGALMKGASDAAAPKMDTSDLIKSAEVLKGLSQELQFLVDKRAEIEETFAAVGQGLKRTQSSLTADIKSTITNIALITTGQAAGEMTQGAAGAALNRNLGRFIDTVGDYFAGQQNGESDKKMLIQMDGGNFGEFLDGKIAKCHVKSN